MKYKFTVMHLQNLNIVAWNMSNLGTKWSESAIKWMIKVEEFGFLPIPINPLCYEHLTAPCIMRLMCQKCSGAPHAVFWMCTCNSVFCQMAASDGFEYGKESIEFQNQLLSFF
jgi:hypothetical protein